MKMVAVWICLALSCVVSTARADDGSAGAVGGTVALMNEHPSVRMVREDVYVRTMKGYPSLRATCRFVFHNDGPACTVKMAFPEDIGGDVSGFRYFTSRVDGRRVSVRRVEPKRGQGRGWRVKDVRFRRGQTRIVVDAYGGAVGGDISGSRYLSYVLKTGSSWHGPIGEAVVTIDIAAYKDWQTVTAAPAGYRRRGSRLTWRFRNVEPKEDISVLFWPGYSAFTVNGRRAANAVFACYAPYMNRGLVVASPEGIGALLGRRVERQRDRGGYVTYTIGKTGSLRLRVGEKSVLLNGRTVELPRASKYRRSDIGDRPVPVLPAAAIMRALGATVTYNSRTGVVHIRTPQGIARRMKG